MPKEIKDVTKEVVMEDLLPPDSNIWKPTDIGDTLKGVVISIDKGDFGKQWIIKTKEGAEVLTPAHTILQQILVHNDVLPGNIIQIEFVGFKDTNKGKPMQLYKVQRAKV